MRGSGGDVVVDDMSQSRSGGFTLMELLVAMTLLGLLMIALFGSVRLGTRVWEASDRVLEDDAQAQPIRAFLRDRLEQTMPITLVLDDGEEIVFSGNRTSLRFASTMPESVGLGPFLMKLALNQANDLALQWRTIDDGASANAGAPDERVILSDLSSISFAFFGSKEAEDGPSTWHSNWEGQFSLPELIRVDFIFAKGDSRDWPPLIVSPRIDEWYDTAS